MMRCSNSQSRRAPAGLGSIKQVRPIDEVIAIRFAPDSGQIGNPANGRKGTSVQAARAQATYVTERPKWNLCLASYDG